MTELSIAWRGSFTDAEVNRLHADAFDHRVFDDRWNTLVVEHSLGWVTARSDDRLVGFVNIVWDGQIHAWIQDTIVAPSAQRSGVGTRLVNAARDEARAAGCEWLHVDFDDHLKSFYFEACGFAPTNAGLIDLTDTET
ncbi:MAG: GNAT family N-acetyltransferase [Acidimicrobiia bacterium]